jgi:hypothetical protein
MHESVLHSQTYLAGLFIKHGADLNSAPKMLHILNEEYNRYIDL